MLEKLKFRSWTFPLTLLLLSILCFGLLIPWLGFYQDDWYLIWLSHFFGANIFFPFFENQRPILALVYIFTTKLVGTSAVGWQIFGLLTRWLAALSVWWALKLAWPNRPKQVAWITVLFLVYPGFQEHFVAVVYSQNYLLITASLIALGLSLWVVRNQTRLTIPLTILGVSLSLLSVFSSEYFFGLEFFRPLLLWVVVGEKISSLWQRLSKTLLYWAPYLAALIFFLVWRIFIFKFPTYQPKLAQQFVSGPSNTILTMAQTVIQDFFDVSLFAWTQTLNFVRTVEPTLLLVVIKWVILLVGAALTIFYLSKFVGKDEEPLEASASIKPSPSWAIQAIMIGVFSVIITGWPFWFAGLEIELDISQERFTLAFMLAVSIMLVGLIELFIKTDRQKIVIIGVMAGLAMGWQLKVAETFREAHAGQETFFQQLVWRAPGLKSGTLLLTNPLPINYSGANSLAAPLNWIYAQNYQYPNMEYELFYIPDKLGNELPALQNGLPITKRYGVITYHGSTSQSLVVYFEPPGCVLVLDPAVYGETPINGLDQPSISIPRLPDSINTAVPISHVGQIIPSADMPIHNFQEIFGQSTTSNWCYYFEKADLARQFSDWPTVVALGDEAARQSLRPVAKQEIEFLPFIEGYAHQGNWKQAARLTRLTAGSVPAMVPILCSTWTRIQQNTSPGIERDTYISNFWSDYGCGEP